MTQLIARVIFKNMYYITIYYDPAQFISEIIRNRNYFEEV